ncbi:Serine/threonine-protein kinase HSL1 [Leucoagaricus sp. SymC.cos]|nr:Serine/threonine-protein kinase HSL1 [Leucoagaricus sp. SymC.cos]
MEQTSESPPRAPPVQYATPLGTRWAKEKAAAGGSTAFDLATDPKNIGPWILGECVGKGASGRVKIARHRRTGQLAAVKILPIAPLVNSRSSLATQQAKSEKQRLGIDREITMMKLMNHPNIMRIYDVFEGEKELFLVLEYVQGGELFDFLVNRGRLPPNEALEYFKQIIYGLNYAHTFSIIHRDLKPENILIASLKPPLIKIADWGMAAFAPPSLQLETSCGSPHYASPEIVNGEKYQGNATDIWSCGVILFALLTGRLPFDDKNVRNLLAKVKTGKYDMPNWIDPLAKDLLSRMLVVDVKKRITIPEILIHPWLTTNYSTCETPDSGVVMLMPPLPPSPSELARPIASPADIDRELLASLKIIWGKHADPDGDNIVRDLCSPPGFGIHAKAFYFLLGRYREETLRKRLTEGPADYQDMSRPSQDGEQRILRIYRPRAQTSPIHQRPHPVLLPTTQVTHSTRKESAPVSSQLPPSPIATSSDVRVRSASQDTTLPLLTALRTVDLVLQHAGDTSEYIQMPSSSSPRHDGRGFSPIIPHQQFSQPSGDSDGRRDRTSRSKTHRNVDKENQSTSDEGWSYIGSDPEQNSLGLGVDVGRDIGKDIGNMPHGMVSPQRGRKDREKKNRPPPLDLPQKNGPLNSLGSPINLASPIQSAPASTVTSGRLMTSPVVGEFKGWFTNLFNWKSSGQGVFYSVHESPRTRMDVGRMLESFGVTVDGIGSTVADVEFGKTLRCRVDLVTVDAATGTTWKPTRFRVEFFSGLSVSPLSPRENLYFPTNMSPANSTATPRGRVTSFIGKSNMSNTALPSPAPFTAVQLPPGYSCAVIVIHEKGSMTTFKAIWRRLKELYGDAPSTHPYFSPAMPTSPFADNNQRFVFNS